MTSKRRLVKNGAFDEDVKKVIAIIREGGSLKEALLKVNISNHSFDGVIGRVPELAAEYARARELRADLMADLVVEVAADYTVNPLHNRNQIDALKWRASKLNPRTYGDTIDLNVNQRVECADILIDARKRFALFTKQLGNKQLIEAEAEL